MTQLRLTALTVTAAAALVLTSCSSPGESASGSTGTSTTEPSTVSVEHAQGTTEVPLDPETVFTFDLGALDTLDTLGIRAAGVPHDSLPPQLADYDGDDTVNIGSLFEPDLETIAAAEPDLIIISGRAAAAYDDLSELAPTIDLSIDDADPMASFTRNTESIGEVFGLEDMVADRLATLDSEIEDTRNAAATAGTGLIVMTSAGEVTAYGEQSRFGLIHNTLGVEPATEVTMDGRHGEAISFEYIAEANPAHLFVIDRDAAIGEAGAAASAVLDNDLVDGTDAASNDAVTYLDSASWYLIGYGLNNLDRMVASVNEAVSA